MKRILRLVGGVLAAGLGTWIVSMFPCLAAAFAGSLVTYSILRDKNRPSPRFWVTWIGGAVTVSAISWMNSLVPPLGCVLSAFLGCVVMIIATLLKEKVRVIPPPNGVMVTPPPQQCQRLRFRGDLMPRGPQQN